MKKATFLKLITLYLIISFLWTRINAQCVNQIFHAKGTETINGIQVNVIPSGDCDTISSYCSGSTQPYLIGANYTYPNHNGGYTFQFSPSVDTITVNFSGIHDNGTDKEIVKIYLNGNHYNIPSVGQPNGCNTLATLTSSGEITGAPNGSSSGWTGTKIAGPISEIAIIDSVVTGTPNGTVFSIFFCSKFKTSIFENTSPNVVVYPNPTRGNITINAPNKSKLEISNMQGQMMFQQILAQGIIDVDLSNFEKGIYILAITHNGAAEVRKIVKD